MKKINNISFIFMFLMNCIINSSNEYKDNIKATSKQLLAEVIHIKEIQALVSEYTRDAIVYDLNILLSDRTAYELRTRHFRL